MQGEAIHVIGAAGAGASAAALLAAAAGAAVSGCDPAAPSPYTQALQEAGITVAPRHDPGHVVELMASAGAAGAPASVPARLAVTKALTSVQPDHPELVAAREAGLPIEAWQQVVADAAMRHGGQLVGIAGTHGKSTSAGWLVHLLVAAGRDPGAFVGALLPTSLTGGSPATARWGRGDVFVIEADEYAGNFEPYRPAIGVVLNADWDHPDVFADQRAVVDAFEAWLCAAPGVEARRAVIGIDDSGGADLAGRLARWGERLTRVTGDASRAGEPGVVVHGHAGDQLFISGLPGQAATTRLDARLRLAGGHNAANAACVATAAALLGVDLRDIRTGLASFGGVARRMEIKGEPAGVLVIDDYGHHPTAIRATLAAVREQHPGRPLWVAHEPLTYHRAAAMLHELAASLATADHVVIADIWPGRDRDTSITSAAALAAAVTEVTGAETAAPGDAEATADYLAERVHAGDIVLAMGGGRSYVIADRLVALLAADEAV